MRQDALALREVLAVARATNDGLDVPLGDSEVAGLAKSVERYRRSWIAKGRFYTEAEREAWGCALGLRSGLARRKSTAARNKSIREDPRINAELASEHGLTVRRIQQIRNQLGGGEIKVDSNYIDSVPLTSEKGREKILTFGPSEKAKPKPSLWVKN